MHCAWPLSTLGSSDAVRPDTSPPITVFDTRDTKLSALDDTCTHQGPSRAGRRLRRGVHPSRLQGQTPHAEWTRRGRQSGGFCKSGNGRGPGIQGLAEYRKTKHIRQSANPKPGHWFEPPQAGVQQ